MVINHQNMDYYLERIKNNQHYSIAGFSDAEWFSMIGHRLRGLTGLGQRIDESTGIRLTDVLKRRQHDSDFLFAIPDVVINGEYFVTSGIAKRINKHIEKNEIHTEWFERDVVTDYLAEFGRMYPFIKQLQKMNVAIIGNKHLRGLGFLAYKHFTEISSPNLHLEYNGIERAVEDAQNYGQPGVYLVSAGVSAALIIDQLHGTISDSWFIDTASIWDAFVGVGEQREWRKTLYADPKKYTEWLNANLHGTEYKKS